MPGVLKKTSDQMKIVYIAGPLFTPAQRNDIEEIGRLCKKLGFKPYMPHVDAGLHLKDDPSEKYFKQDLAAMNSADFCIAILDGSDVDSGTAFEIGYLYAKKIPAIGILRDSRFPKPREQMNVMIANGNYKVVTSLEELEQVLKNYL